MQVSESVKNAYQNNSITRHLTLCFPDLGMEIGTDRIYFESMQLSESVMESDSIEFVGCISSKFSVQVYGITDDIKGRRITAKVHTDGTEDEPIILFNGIVDSAVMESNRGYKKITAYDALYSAGSVNCAEWYNALPFPVTIKGMRDSLFKYLEIEQEECELPNDGIEITQMYDPATLNALDLVKSICQINGAFGIINRNGKFEYRFVPGPGELEENSEEINFYKSVEYEEYRVKPVDKLTIRQGSDDAGVSFGEGMNNYIIQANLLAYGLDDTTLKTMAENIYNKVCSFSYCPFESDNNGLPFAEVGSGGVSYEIMDMDTQEYVKKSFFVLRRELKGLQNMRDSYSAEGEEYQSEFVTDINAQIASLEMSQNELSALKLVVYTYQNKSRYALNAVKETEIIKINYSAIENATPVFNATIPLTVTGNGIITLRYYTDAVLHSQDTLVQNLGSGKHFLTLSNFFTIEKNGRATLTVTAQTEDGMSAVIAANTVRAVLFAQGLAGAGKWDGTLNLTDEIGMVKAGRVKAAKITDALSVTKPQIYGSIVTEKFRTVKTGKQKFAGVTDACSVYSTDGQQE